MCRSVHYSINTTILKFLQRQTFLECLKTKGEKWRWLKIHNCEMTQEYYVYNCNKGLHLLGLKHYLDLRLTLAITINLFYVYYELE